MLIDSLAHVLERSRCLDGFWGKLDEGRDAAIGVASSARPLLVAARFARAPQTTLVVVAGEEAAESFARQLRSYLGDERVMRFPERQDHPSLRDRADPACTARRMEALCALATGRQVVVVAGARALIRRLPPVSARCFEPLRLVAGMELGEMPGMLEAEVLELGDLLRALVSRGYCNPGELEGPGSFAVRGGIVDVWPATLAFPVRLDFFGDELDEARRIVPSTGQTIAPLERVEVYPASELPLAASSLRRARDDLRQRARTNKDVREVYELLEGGARFDGEDVLLPFLFEKTATVGDYLGAGVLTCLIEPRALFDDMTHAFDEVDVAAQGTSFPAEGNYAMPAEVDFGSNQRATYLSIMRVGSHTDVDVPVKRTEVAGDPERLFGRLHSLLEGGYTTVLCVPERRAREDMKLALVDHGLPFRQRLDEGEADAQRRPAAGPPSSALQADAAAGEPAKRRLSRSAVNLVDADVPLGMVIPKAKLALVSLADTHRASAARLGRRVDVTEITFPYNPGDYVVHAAHGVAYFAGLVRREVDGTTRDYLQLDYAEGDKLFVPVEQLDRVTRYVGPEGSSPRLTRLNTADWSRAMRRTRAVTSRLAFDLVDVYARRAAAQGYRFGPDTPEQLEMEQAFPYDETEDQLAAIADVKADMRSSKPMDRLVCGDVGFGKTEVALRAAFLATQYGKQVMVLCPTTILAQQHYVSFSERCEPFGVRVEVLSRFRTAAQQREALEGFANGEVDILIGTHRLLSRDVNPHDLGLVVIDEEQRFGVGHKEQLKHLRESVDVLTLSATPIPRTMQMSLSGVRDMSIILTPPDERLPVKVHVGEWDPDLVGEAIRRELARGGQVYYVSNRVRTIGYAARCVREVAGEARVGVAHGKMSREELERVMEDFSAGQLDVLVATTIIESGIDNPHTNTLIIEDSQRLGLAQMYQLKGRVGRSSVQAYAYFLFPEEVPLTDEARERLLALSEHTDLGSGMRVAMRDLEIRGAGSILGAEQSGNMSAVGFDLYAQMLAQAVNAAREGDPAGAEELPPAPSDITVNIPGKAYLPDEYVPDVDERVLWYRKIANAGSVFDALAVREELEQKRPDPPQEACNLLDKMHIRAFANEHGIKVVSVTGGVLVVEPVALNEAQLRPLRRSGARYLAEKRRLRLPLRHFKLEEGEPVYAAVAELLEDLAAGRADGQR